ncbi:venom allergen 3-like [Schistocerca nitens]|uniref:venom allergen 3-like n=1 Tax=Schistocerca nitens TaxID=7011 RepID=UPI002118387E|nr:venom allergen 3-like [Schistocerca nitens]
MVTVVQLLLLLPPLPLLAVDYCALCRAPGSHTLCLYPEAGPSAACTGYVPAPLTAAEKKALLDTHNGLRSRVALGQGWSPNSTHDAQPKAANMRQMYWDDELASTAQRWADRCDSFYTTRPHDECRDSPRFPVGQNVVTTAYNFPLPKDVRSRVREWYNEIDDFDPSWVSSFSFQPVEDRPTAHYTQLVWGWTYLLGCGRAVFHELINGELWMVERLVCNYGPSGNFLGLPLYEEGDPCSRCPNGTRCSDAYPGLCQIDENYNATTTPLPPLWSFTTRPPGGSTSKSPAADGGGSTQRASVAPSTTTQQARPTTTEKARSSTEGTRPTTMLRATTAPPATETTTATTASYVGSTESESATDEGTTTEAVATTTEPVTTEVVTTEAAAENSIAE